MVSFRSSSVRVTLLIKSSGGLLGWNCSESSQPWGRGFSQCIRPFRPGMALLYCVCRTLSSLLPDLLLGVQIRIPIRQFTVIQNDILVEICISNFLSIRALDCAGWWLIFRLFTILDINSTFPRRFRFTFHISPQLPTDSVHPSSTCLGWWYHLGRRRRWHCWLSSPEAC